MPKNSEKIEVEEPLQDFNFPHYSVTIKAKDQIDALEKLKKFLKDNQS